MKSSTISEKNSKERLIRSHIDQLILNKLKEKHYAIKVSELAESLGIEGMNTTSVRAFLSSNPEVYAYTERRWVPASRVHSDAKSLHECIHQLISRYGAPIDFALLSREVSYARGVYEEEYMPVVRRMVEKSNDFVLTDLDKVALLDWFFVASDETTDKGLALNNVDKKEFDALYSKAKGLNWFEDSTYAKFISENAPVSVKTLGAAIWRSIVPENCSDVIFFNANDCARRMLSVPGFVYGVDGCVYPDSEANKWVSGALELSKLLVPVIEADDVAPLNIKSEDVNKMVTKISGADKTVTVEELLESFYEITPHVKSFDDDLLNLTEALSEDGRVAWVGGDRFTNPKRIPEIVQNIPEPLLYQDTEFTDEDGEKVDFTISDEGLSSSLRKLLQHPLACDVQDEDTPIPPKPRMQQYRLVLKSIHRELGTFPISQLPSDWINTAPEIQELIFIDVNGKKHQVWANNKERLLFNLIDLWFEQPVESGGVFTIAKTDKQNVFQFEWMEQPDPVVFITPQRMDELREIQANSADKSSYEILKEVISHWAKGADFLSILWEMNVVRRTSRRLLASLLSGYQCFFQRSGSPVWHYDHKKVELGVDKTKKKFIIK